MVKDINAKLNAASTSATIAGIMSGLIFSAFLIYLSLTEYSCFRFVILFSLVLSTILFIFAAITYSMANDCLVFENGRDWERLVNIAERISSISLISFLSSVVLVSLSVHWIFGIVIGITIVTIFIIWYKLCAPSFWP
jgi:hypothetical protein